jgi:protocatechuate 3,4-dioxygenase beta subunit
VVPSGSDGAFRFRTVVPGAYPASPTWTRPPHIHLKVAKAGYLELVTQMYFPGHPLNGRDHLLLRKTADERTRMIATDAGIGGDGLRIFRFAVVIERIG